MTLLRGPYRGIIKPRFIYGDFLQNVIPDYRTGWFMQEPSGPVALATNIAVTVPDTRNVATLTYAAYTPGANWANPSGQIARHTAGSTATIKQTGIIAAGKTWEYPIVISNRTAGSVSVTGGDVSASANDTTIITITAIGADVIIIPTNDFDGDIDLAQGTVKQTNIAASSAFSTPGDNPLDGTYTAVTLGVAGNRQIPYMVAFNGATSYLDIYSAELNSAWNPDAGAMVANVRVADSSVWSSGNYWIWGLSADVNNNYRMRIASGALQFVHTAGGTQKLVSLAQSLLGVMQVVMTWDVTANEGAGEMKAYLNGAQFGSTQTDLGTWVGNLNSTLCVIGAQNKTPNNSFYGDIGYAELYNRALSESEALRIVKAGGVA